MEDWLIDRKGEGINGLFFSLGGFNQWGVVSKVRVAGIPFLGVCCSLGAQGAVFYLEPTSQHDQQDARQRGAQCRQGNLLPRMLSS